MCNFYRRLPIFYWSHFLCKLFVLEVIALAIEPKVKLNFDIYQILKFRDSGNPDEVSHVSKSFTNSNTILAEKNDPDR